MTPQESKTLASDIAKAQFRYTIKQITIKPYEWSEAVQGYRAYTISNRKPFLVTNATQFFNNHAIAKIGTEALAGTHGLNTVVPVQIPGNYLNNNLLAFTNRMDGTQVLLPISNPYTLIDTRYFNEADALIKVEENTIDNDGLITVLYLELNPEA